MMISVKEIFDILSHEDKFEMASIVSNWLERQNRAMEIPLLLTEDEKRDLADGKKIQVVKSVRYRTRLTLRESLDFVNIQLEILKKGMDDDSSRDFR